MLKLGLTVLFFLMSFAMSQAKVLTENVAYSHGDVKLEGYIAWDDSIKGKRPGVLVVHEWWGVNDYARKRAKQLASQGYVAFALDMYGKRMVTTHPDQASKWMKEIQSNVKAWQERAVEGLKILRKNDHVDLDRIAAIGYCFGGATVLQLAYSGASIKGVVSFHGALPIPDEKQAAQTKAKILIAHGNADPFLTEDHIKKFKSALERGKLDWQMIVYSGARHSFTNPGADQFGMDPLRYNKEADVRSWQHMQLFFDEIFAESP